ncbi:MAG: hypothetical protein A3B38_01980 [Candidatus Levybacteria bacterium RIFCSPLOWO2_01_FULL_36_13]|nr:MAG: hypothetical protein A2684_03215 [Candidatus Levybacteria bacterium RIFCSPHIGHO2_01_FULL_36_15b]OGH35631.1 MAG: hypothetical protein A3B38_01980 [Candidatus Levybacteria bacterium RIFCSPLOWO2_01_FULL_36_13]
MKSFLNTINIKQSLLLTFLVFLLGFLFYLLNITSALAYESSISCNNRFVTLVNPVRSRSLWLDKSLNPLINQYSSIKQRGFPATWLLQYDVFSDKKLMEQIKGLNPKQEKGLLLEISPQLASDARVIYPVNTPWFFPNAAFLSGYTQSERIKLIDTLFEKFKNQNSYYPKSVGAWWIDSFSLNYMVEKFSITSALILADQKTTDSYGVWGQWWGVPFYPSKANILTPASNLENKQNVVIIQWAQRDLTKAHGQGPEFSNYSLQANDYIKQGENTNYFNDLIKVYLDCHNQLGQVTVGLETGSESVDYLEEYKNQLENLSKYPNLEFVTMQDFAETFQKVYPKFPEKITLADELSTWLLSTKVRENAYLRDRIKYELNKSFADYFIEDNQSFLNRALSSNTSTNKENYSDQIILLIIFFSLIIFKKLKKLGIWFIAFLFIFASFGLLMRSHIQFSWLVFYGPVVDNLLLFKSLCILLSLSIFYFISKKFNKKMLLFVPLSFGLDFILTLPRYIQLGDRYYFGLSLDALRFLGVSISKTSLYFINQDFLAYQAASLLKFNFGKIWNNLLISFLIYPLVHFLLGVVLYLVYKRLPIGLKNPFLLILLILCFGWLIYIFNIDPTQVK